MVDITNLTITKAHELLSKKEVTVRELVDAYKAQAHATVGLNAYREIFEFDTEAA